jgi:predicted HicB family RNase H-like nuclease
MTSHMKAKGKAVLAVAEDFFNTGPDWVTFFREMLGINGAVRTAFPDPKALAAFEATKEYDEIQQMVKLLREKATDVPPKEVTRVITIRLPQSLHESLMAEAWAFRTSMNKLCLSKLMQIIDEGLVPNDRPGLPKERDATIEQ